MNREFAAIKINDLAKTKIDGIRATFDGLLDYCSGLNIEPRYLAIVKTKLEEAAFFANKGVCLTHQVTE